MIRSKHSLNNFLKNYFFVIALFCSLSVQAEINLRNGNYHVKYSDIVMKVGEESLRVDRDYNSHHRHIGIFGYGWTSELETNLVKTKKHLELKEFGINPAVKFFKVSASHFQNSIGETITINLKNSKMKYKLDSSNQSTYHFDADGRLVRKTYPSGYHFVISYKNKLISTLQDSQGKQLRFLLSDKKIQKIESSLGKVSLYKYKKNLLVNVINEDKNSFMYDYLSNGLLQRIRVNGKKLRSIEYDLKTAHVKKIVEADKATTRYEYTSSVRNPLDFSVTVLKKDGTANFHYISGKREDGSEYVKSLDFVSNKKKIKTMYSKKCELPIRIEVKQGWEGLTYNQNCLLVSKRDSKGNKLDITYENGNRLIKQVKLNDYIVDYKYGDRNRPSVITDSKKRKVEIAYDLYGRTRRVKINTPKEKQQEVLFDYSQRNLKQFSLKVNKKDIVQAYYDENNNIVFDEDINDKTEEKINIVFSTMNYLLNAHRF